ncbi:11654_t:CDS:2, partial [Cetraspora pellucida]
MYQKVLNFAVLEESLKKQLETCAKSESVVAFKSIASCRPGLNIFCDPNNNEDVTSILGNLVSDFESLPDMKGSVRQVIRILIDYILKMAIDIAINLNITGFGGSDIDLIEFNPLLLRPLIEEYPNAKFVLLHAAYPYSRQSGYLASVYSNVYVDIGLVFPLISASGQQAILREL